MVRVLPAAVRYPPPGPTSVRLLPSYCHRCPVVPSATVKYRVLPTAVRRRARLYQSVLALISVRLLPSYFHNPPSPLTKYTVPPAALISVGPLGLKLGPPPSNKENPDPVMRTVPAVVPSVLHNCWPDSPSLAEK